MPEEGSSLPEDIRKLDSYDMRGAILETPLLAEKGYKLVEGLDLGKTNRKYTSVIVAGMGGSSIAGLLLQSYLTNEKLRLDVVQDYSLPMWADTNTLVMACSFSGNTEETITVFKEARRRGCGVIAISKGGKLEEYTKVSRTPIVILPPTPPRYQPRTGMTTQFFAMLRILERLRLVESRAKEVFRLKDDLKPQLQILERNAMALSEKLIYKTPIIYTSKRFEAVGYRWKCQFNENSKIMAFNNVFSEMNHNELEGFENPRGNYHSIILRFDEDHRRIQRRMSLVKEIMLKKGISDTEIGIRGPSLLSKMFSAIILGDLTSYHLALRLKAEPSLVYLIEDFKKRLGPYVA
ncbi:bifunctional phosphoglucose/phosphomannose isomerase [Candidatus Woesearchaeota archaeon]|nr:bifunctional phosphoglucose/phosphomannose isomerase [Candidatus Woesearchaeota archaeon]